jgi:two-component system phosphate regulon sensor histidine kinase PhoR
VRRTRLLWQLFPTYLLITMLAVVAASVYAFLSLSHFYRDETARVLTVRAQLVRERLAVESSGADLDRLVKDLGRAAETRLTVVLPSGVVVADSDAVPAEMENHGDRPEIAAALEGRTGVATRASATTGRRTLYVAVPMEAGGRVVGAVRAALPATALAAELAAVRRKLAVSAVLVCALAAVVSLLVSRRLSRPIEEMTQGAARFARGELAYTLRVPETRELADLAESLNAMARELDARVRAMDEKLAEEDAVLTGMAEGVIGVDAMGRIMSMNRAAGELLGGDPGALKGRDLREVVRSSDIQALVSEALEGAGPVEREVAPLRPGQELLQGRAAPLRGPDGRSAGAVLVLNDVTRLRRLESMRRDFVTNVSHELRTPVTAIRGYAEMMLDEPEADPAQSRQFIAVIARNAERLGSLIDDLLRLSRIEQDEGRPGMDREDAALADVLRSAAASRGSLAAERGVAVRVACAEDVRAVVNPALFEHAVANLVDNAVKYSEPGGDVEVEGRDDGSTVVVAVRDRGVGIPEEHLGRIFERFYRVDKGRSRELGGTGLGLAIVKHIVSAHGGSVDVESAPGQGSTFTIRIPKA